MIEYKLEDLTLNCYLKDNYVHFECNGIVFESTSRKITKEEDIAAYLDDIFKSKEQVKALLYCVKCSESKSK